MKPVNQDTWNYKDTIHLAMIPNGTLTRYQENKDTHNWYQVVHDT